MARPLLLGVLHAGVTLLLLAGVFVLLASTPLEAWVQGVRCDKLLAASRPWQQQQHYDRVVQSLDDALRQKLQPGCPQALQGQKVRVTRLWAWQVEPPQRSVLLRQALAEAERLAQPDLIHLVGADLKYEALWTQHAELEGKMGQRTADHARDREGAQRLRAQVQTLEAQLTNDQQRFHTELTRSQERFSTELTHSQERFHTQLAHSQERFDVLIKAVELAERLWTTKTCEVVKFVLPEVLFEHGKAELRAEGAGILKRMVGPLNQGTLKQQLIDVEGYTDNTGSDDTNQRLSKARAEQVVKVLSGYGIAANRLRAQGHGAKQPVESNDTPEGQAHNRRVELTVQPAACR